MEDREVKSGRYKHFKGGEVEVIGVGKHSETHEEMVIYRHMEIGGVQGIWVRPYKSFIEDVEVEGRRIPRFKYLGDAGRM